MRVCWCGNDNFLPFGPEYGQCDICGTLVYLKEMLPDQLIVQNDETDFYGKKYWLEHQQEAFGYDSIQTRARKDLTERILHWLKTLLKYRLPPARVLELGCSHGGFVALLRQAGFDASGVEMSPWVVEFGRKTFDVPISLGPVETLKIPDESLDVIALMDVLEHFSDPIATMTHCLKLLKSDGLLLLQTPQYKEGMIYTELVESNHPFLEQLKFDEHLYLFSEGSVASMFNKIGAGYIRFEPAIFGHYDMFFAVSKTQMRTNLPQQIESALLDTANGRLVLALIDLRQKEEESNQKLQELEVSVAARGEQVETLTNMLKESETDRAARGEQIETLTNMLKESEADRTARGEQVETLTRMLKDPKTK